MFCYALDGPRAIVFLFHKVEQQKRRCGYGCSKIRPVT